MDCRGWFTKKYRKCLSNSVGQVGSLEKMNRVEFLIRTFGLIVTVGRKLEER